MTTLTRTKLTDTQFVALSGAAQRQGGTVSLPERIKGMAAQKLATRLIDKGFVRGSEPNPAWGRGEDARTYARVITKLGRATLRIADDGSTSRDAVKSVGLPNPRSREGKRRLSPTRIASDAEVDDAPDQVPAHKRDLARTQLSDHTSRGYQSADGQSINSPRQGGKLAKVLALLEREAGASLEELTVATGWLPHTARAALTGLRKRGYTLLREGKAEGGSVYRIIGAAQARTA